MGGLPRAGGLHDSAAGVRDVGCVPQGLTGDTRWTGLTWGPHSEPPSPRPRPGGRGERSSSVSRLLNVRLWAVCLLLTVPQNDLRRPSFLKPSFLPLILAPGVPASGSSREGLGAQSAAGLSPCVLLPNIQVSCRTGPYLSWCDSTSQRQKKKMLLFLGKTHSFIHFLCRQK